MDSSLGLTDCIEAFRQIKRICERVIVRYQQKIDQIQLQQTQPQPQPQLKREVQNSKNVDITEKIDIVEQVTVSKPVQSKQPNEPAVRAQLKKSKKSQQIKKKPKSPMTPYFLFFNKKREIIRSKYPHLSQTEMANIAGQVWRSMSASEKQPYEKQYARNKIVYKKILSQYYEQNPEEMPNNLRRQKEKENPVENDQDDYQSIQEESS